jgi:hypothetical protein
MLKLMKTHPTGYRTASNTHNDMVIRSLTRHESMTAAESAVSMDAPTKMHPPPINARTSHKENAIFIHGTSYDDAHLPAIPVANRRSASSSRAGKGNRLHRHMVESGGVVR